MTITDLQSLLDDLASEAESRGLDPEKIEVRLAHQPRWALEYSIRNAVIAYAKAEGAPAEDEDDDRTPVNQFDKSRDRQDDAVVYLTEGSQLGYLPCKLEGWND